MRIANDSIELRVCAETGRIVHFSTLGGPNVLWENPRARETPSVFPGWQNWGGDKVWLWPEDDWRKWSPTTTHPPGDPPCEPWEVTSDGLTLRMTSPIVPDYGLRSVRKISLSPSGTNVSIANRFEQITAPAQPLPVAIWTVAQLPAATPITAHLAPDAIAPGYAHFSGGEWQSIEPRGENIILHRTASPWQKIGLDADRLSTRIGKHLFTAEATDTTTGHTPHRRAQVFSDPDHSPFRLTGTPPYIELEFTSPVQRLEQGEATSMTIHWSLR